MSLSVANLEWEQLERPSYHSYVLLLSHVSFLLSIVAAFRRRLVLESFSLVLSGLISVGYHVCDENLYCAFGWSIYQWHAMDVWSTFFLICFVLCVMVLDIRARRTKYIVRAAYFAVVTGAVWYDRSSLMIFSGLLGSVAFLVVFRYGVQRHYAVRQSMQQRSGYRGPVGGGVENLVIGLAVFCCSLACFVLANTPIVGRLLHDSRDGPKPMDVPDTTVYWAFHSVWHFSSALSAYLIIRFIRR
jgi:hypothetical protein